jgi:hypothetical protein
MTILVVGSVVVVFTEVHPENTTQTDNNIEQKIYRAPFDKLRNEIFLLFDVYQ